jgi:hypothetical protein
MSGILIGVAVTSRVASPEVESAFPPRSGHSHHWPMINLGS